MWHVIGGCSKDASATVARRLILRQYWRHDNVCCEFAVDLFRDYSPAYLIHGSFTRVLQAYGSGPMLGAGACQESRTGLRYRSWELYMHNVMQVIGPLYAEVSPRIRARMPYQGPGLSFIFTSLHRGASGSQLFCTVNAPVETPTPHWCLLLKTAPQYRSHAAGRLVASLLCTRKFDSMCGAGYTRARFRTAQSEG